jgi:hypothetical protein
MKRVYRCADGVQAPPAFDAATENNEARTKAGFIARQQLAAGFRQSNQDRLPFMKKT